MNHDLYNVYKHADIVTLIKHGSPQWVGQIARIVDEGQAMVIFSREPDDTGMLILL